MHARRNGTLRERDAGTISAVLIVALLAAAFSVSCAQPAAEKKDDKAPRHVYKDLQAEVMPVPEGVREALPGLQNDNIYVYREISPVITLISYEKDYGREEAMRMAARAFLALLGKKEHEEGIDFWIIQVQADPGGDKAADGGGKARLVVWGVRPEEAKKYAAEKDLAAFIENSEYLLVDDVIIPAGPRRLEQFPKIAAAGKKSEEGPGPEPGDTAASEDGPADGATEAPGDGNE